MAQAPANLDPSEDDARAVEEYVAANGEVTLSELHDVTGLNTAALFKLTTALVEAGDFVQVNSFTYRAAGAVAEPSTDAESEAPPTPSEPEDPEQATEAAAPEPEPDPPSASTGESAAQATPLFDRPASTREKAWGAVLLAVAAPLVAIAGTAFYSVYAGGILGILSVEMAVAIGAVVGLIGAIGAVQGIRAYRGMRE